MKIAVSDAESHLADLVRRAEGGEEVVLTRSGAPAVRLVPVHDQRDPEVRAAIIDAICAVAAARALPDTSAGSSHDFLYDDETGLPV